MESEHKRQHWANRHYTPTEAAYAAAEYLKLDPGVFLQQCEHAGVDVQTDGKLIHFFRDEGEYDRTTFLMAWLRLSGQGKAVRTSLKRRGRIVHRQDLREPNDIADVRHGGARARTESEVAR